MIPCIPPAAGQAQPYQFSNFNVQSSAIHTDGSVINTVFPFCTRLSTISFNQPSGLTAISITSSIINELAGDVVGIFVTLDSGVILNLDGHTPVFLSHLCLQQSTPAFRNASSRTNTIVMGENTYYRLPSGSKLGIYACSDNDAGNEIAALISAYWIPVPGL